MLSGTTQRVLVDKVSERFEGHVPGSTETNCIVHFPGDASLIGKFADVVISDTVSMVALRADNAPIWTEG